LRKEKYSSSQGFDKKKKPDKSKQGANSFLWLMLTFLNSLFITNKKMCNLFVDKYQGLDLIIGVFSLYIKEIEDEHVGKASEKMTALERFQYNLPENQRKRKAEFAQILLTLATTNPDVVKFMQCTFAVLGTISLVLPTKIQTLLLKKYHGQKVKVDSRGK